jgi:hypothetical protein
VQQRFVLGLKQRLHYGKALLRPNWQAIGFRTQPLLQRPNLRRSAKDGGIRVPW